MRTESAITGVSREQVEDFAKHVRIDTETTDYGTAEYVARIGNWVVRRDCNPRNFSIIGCDEVLPDGPQYPSRINNLVFDMLQDCIDQYTEFRWAEKQKKARETRQEELDFMALVLGLYPG